VKVTGFPAEQVVSGTLADARLSSNVPLKNAANTFTANQLISGGNLRSTGTNSAIIIGRRDTAADAWAWYSDAGVLQLYNYVGAADALKCNTAGEFGIGGDPVAAWKLTAYGIGKFTHGVYGSSVVATGENSAGGVHGYFLEHIAGGTTTIPIGPNGARVTIKGATDDTVNALQVQGGVRSTGAYSGWGIVPVGTIVAWAKNLTGTPSLPAGWVECNGQTLNDAASPYHLQAIPDLNGSASGTQLFVRGHTVSGGIGGTSSHCHSVCVSWGVCTNSLSTSGSDSSYNFVESSDTSATGSTDDVPHIPPYYEAVMIIRVK
jgi:hypothetical protein